MCQALCQGPGRHSALHRPVMFQSGSGSCLLIPDGLPSGFSPGPFAVSLFLSSVLRQTPRVGQEVCYRLQDFLKEPGAKQSSVQRFLSYIGCLCV